MNRLTHRLHRQPRTEPDAQSAAIDPNPFWIQPEADLLASLGTTAAGLSSSAARQKQAEFASAAIAGRTTRSDLRLLLSQFTNPIILILVAAAILSLVVGDPIDSGIILVIVGASGLLGFWQERAASQAVAELLARVAVECETLRDGVLVAVPIDGIVPGDIVTLKAGDIIPGDARVLQADALQLDEAPLTGEPFPVAKEPGVLPLDTPVSRRTNVVFMGSSVVSGRGTIVVVRVGTDTQFGALAGELSARPAPSGFEQGISSFGYLLARIMFVLVAAIFVGNLILHRPFIDSLLFSLALAVGITPQLLPAIVAISLATGARQMAHKQVIVKRLDAIEDFGAMSVLFTDKTGTLTEGAVSLAQATDAGGDVAGAGADRVRRLGWINAHFQTGYANPLDSAILQSVQLDAADMTLLDEAPYDFTRKRLSVLVQEGDAVELITKGSLDSVLSVCRTARSDGTSVPLDSVRAAIDQQLHDLSAAGYRVLGIASRAMPGARECSLADEQGMVFEGLLAFSDPPKADAAAAIVELGQLGISVRMLTGDNALAAAHAAAAVGLTTPRVLTGSDLASIPDDQLFAQIENVTVFADVTPDLKKRILTAFREHGEVAGFLGDGINDAPSLHAADVGISVDSAVDVARQAAAIVLLDNNLSVIADGVRLGRKTFVNTMKYVNVNTSASFGNVLSMAIAAVVLPFLPMLPTQILLLNFMSDIPDTTIASDHVDPEQVAAPQRWNLAYIRRFMLIFGGISTVFDMITFTVLRQVFSAGPELFHTGWFLVSMLTELVVLFVLRTRRPFFRSRPGFVLLAASAAMAVIAILLPRTPLAKNLGLVPLGASVFAAMIGIVALYIVVTEIAKRFEVRRSRV